MTVRTRKGLCNSNAKERTYQLLSPIVPEFFLHAKSSVLLNEKVKM